MNWVYITMGALLVLAVFSGIFYGHAREMGWRNALLVWLLGLVGAGITVLGVYLIETGLGH